ncbi:MAG: S-layer homology domain-containing protein, partial [Oscillospiraceae bacterium]|nr:S-layer homology domain-containing protein [Oscillospiraceae bacterium]
VVVVEGSRYAVGGYKGITLGEGLMIVEPEGGEIGQLNEGGNYYILVNGASATRAAIGKACTVAAGVNPAGGGTVTGTKKYVKSDDAVLSAEPTTGYKFVNWTEDGNAVSTDNPYTFTVTGDRNLVANFEKQTFTVKFVNEDGTEMQSSAVEYGDTPTYGGETPTKEATAQYTYSFAGWSPEIVPVTQATVYTATYNSELRKYTVSFDANGQGTAPASQELEYGSAATEPDNPTAGGYRFGGWYTESACENQYDFSEPVTGDITLYAKWSRSSGGGGASGASSADAAPTENGDVGISPAKATAGVDVTVTPAADEGYEVDSVTVTDKDGREVPVTQNSDGTYTFVMPEGGATVTATFKEKAPDDNPPDDTPPDDNPPADRPSAPFKDVDPEQWYIDSIDYVVEKGLMNGVAEDSFDPGGTTTRAMIVTILYRLEGEPEAEGENAFDDVEDGQWYTDAVIWANVNEIVKGYGEGRFGPADNITREQFATILYRYAQLKGYDVSVGEDTNILSYNDAFDISEWAMPAMQWACGAELMQGDNHGNLLPGDNATRAQAATLFMRFAENVK